MFNPKTVTVEEAIARRLITEWCEVYRAAFETSPKSRRAAIASARLAGACEVAAIALGAPTPFAVHLDVAEVIQAHPAILTPTTAFPVERKAAVESAVSSLLAKWGAA